MLATDVANTRCKFPEALCISSIRPIDKPHQLLEIQRPGLIYLPHSFELSSSEDRMKLRSQRVARGEQEAPMILHFTWEPSF